MKSALYSHYETVVVRDRLERYPSRKHSHEVPGIKRVTLAWTLMELDMDAKNRASTWRALKRRTGKTPQRSRSKKSVATWRRRQGDYVGSYVHRTGKEAYSIRETCIQRGRPQTRPFEGYPRSVVDDRGNCTVRRDQPIAFPVLEHYYDELSYICSKPGLSRSIDTGSQNRNQGRSRLTARQFPLVSKLRA